MVPAWSRFVALGDSFTEGLEDDMRPDGRHRGWSDRVADALADHAHAEGVADFRYANLAVRGRLAPEVIEEQVPLAVELGPDLVTLGAGVNDTLRPHFDLNRIATAMERGVRTLRATGADVLLFEFGDPARRSRVMRPVADRIRAYNTALQDIGRRYGCYRVSFWQVAVFDDPQVWASDWLHLAPAGHEITARMVLSELGVEAPTSGPDQDWRTPLVPRPVPSRSRRLAANARWTRDHLAPWMLRRLRGESSGDAVTAKQPEWRAWG